MKRFSCAISRRFKRAEMGRLAGGLAMTRPCRLFLDCGCDPGLPVTAHLT